MQFTYALTGTINGLGKHAAGVGVSSTPLTNGVNGVLCRRNGSLTLNWDKKNVEDQGIIKFDILGLAEVGVIADTFAMIKDNYGIELDYEDIPMGDDRVFKMLSRGHTTGVFQISGWSATKIAKEMKIDNFDDICLVSAICRPGPDSDQIIKNKKRNRWAKIHPKVDEILDSTYGVLCYQEQAMKIFNVVAGYSKVNTETMRKVIAKSMGVTEMNRHKKTFFTGCAKIGYVTEPQASKLWDDMVEFSKYSFNLSHCVAYSYISYINAWLKVNYPAEFVACGLTYAGDDKAKAIFEDATNNLRLDIKLPKIGLSKSSAWTAKDKSLVAPYKSIKGVGEKMAIIMEEYKEPVNSGFFDLGFNAEGLPKKAVELLDRIYGFDEDKRLSLAELRNVNELFAFDTLLLL
tara:strand:+ start:4446 stop:5657 length:1212 start_codon:yes stop_codon:yes gene_type:complete